MRAASIALLSVSADLAAADWAGAEATCPGAAVVITMTSARQIPVIVFIGLLGLLRANDENITIPASPAPVEIQSIYLPDCKCLWTGFFLGTSPLEGGP